MNVQANHKIVMPRFRRPCRKVTFKPIDAFCIIDPGYLSHRPPIRYGRCGNIYCRHLPATLGEPERGCAMSTAGIEGASRGEVGSLGNQMRVGWTVRDLIGLLAQRRRPELFPEVLIKF